MPGPGQVEIRVVGQVENRRLVRLGDILNAQFVPVRQRVSHRHLEIAGEMLLPIQAQPGEAHRRRILAEHFRCPELLVESLQPAVQGIRPVVFRQLIGFPVQGEAPFGDSIAIAPDDRP